MKSVYRVLFSTLVLLYGISNVDAQITDAIVIMVGEDSINVFPNLTPTSGTLVVEKKPHFEIRNRKLERIDEFQITGGEVYAFDGESKLKIGSITENCQFDDSTNMYLETLQEIKIEVVLAVKSRVEETQLTMNYTFYVNLESPSAYLGKITNGTPPVALKEVARAGKVELFLSESPKLLEYSIFGGIVIVEGAHLTGKILENGVFDSNAKMILSQSAGKKVTMLVNYIDAISGEKKRTSLVFKVLG